MKLFLVFALFSTGVAFAQTGLIAHKSHSGTAATFTFADPGNFGAPSPTLVSVKWLNDSTVVQKMDRWGGNREDTLYNHPIYSDPNIPLDSIRKMNWFENVEYIDTAKRLRSYEAQPAKTKSAEPAAKPSDRQKPSPKMNEDEPVKKRSLIWFLIIGGGTFSGMMLLARRKKLQPAG